VREDFLKLGIILFFFGLLAILFTIAYENVYRFMRSADYVVLAIGTIASVAGLIYIVAGFANRSVNAPRPKASPPTEEPKAEADTDAKTGPGWHCSWCWAPLPEGSKYCHKCGKRIE
jgi:hypothetical protein